MKIIYLNKIGFNCDNDDVTDTNSDYCKNLTSDGFCIKGTTIYELTANDGTNDGTCTAITANSIKLYKDDKTGEVSSVTEGSTKAFIYNCVSTSGATSVCNPIASGYYIANVSSTDYLFSCDGSECTSVDPDEGYYVPSTSETTNKLYNYVGSSLSGKAANDINEGYYINASSDSKLIYCNSSKTCTPVLDSTIKSSSYYVSGEDYDSTNSAYKKLFFCNADKNCFDAAEVIATAFYTNGNPNKILIDCTVGVDKCKEAETVNVGYYLNGDGLTGTTVSSLFNCGSNGCEKVTPNKQGYYIDGSGFISSGKYEKLIQCTPNTTDNTKCDFADFTMPTSGVNFLIDGEEASKVIKCTYDTQNSKNVCEKITGEIKAGYGYIDFGTAGNIIACTDGTCSSLVNGNAQTGTPALNTGFLDASKGTDASKNIIICETTGPSCTSTPMATSGTQGHAFLDGTSFDATAATFSNIITCNGSGSCTPLTTIPTYSSAEAYIDAGSPSGTSPNIKYENMIKPETSGTTTTFTVVAGDKANALYAYIDATDPKKVIKCDDTTVTCKSDTNKATNEKAFYINGLAPTEIIVCEAEDANCSKIVGSSETGVSKYYADILTAAGNIITCVGPTNADPPVTSNCASANHAGTTNSADAFYVDGYSGGVLKCPASAKCTPVASANTDSGSGYINFDDSTIIQCSKLVSNESRGRKTTSATAETETKVTITCSALDAVTGSDTYYYIDANSTDKIIACNSSGCDNTTPAETDPAMAYINPDATSVIQCAEKVVNSNTVTECVYREGSSATLPVVHYIDAPTTKSIITCKTSGTKSVCETNSGVTDDGYAYLDYVNTGSVIKCTSTECASSTSMAVAATKQLPVQNANYIDGYDTNKQTLITCINSNSETPNVNCTSTSLKSLPEGQVFLEGTTYSSGYTKIIKWDSTNNYLVVDAPTKTLADGFAYIDGSDKDLKRIITYESSKYVAKESDASGDTNKFYIDGLNTANIITCTNEGCSSDTGSTTLGEAYIGGMDSKKVITCASGGTGCTSASGVDSTNKADSYINGDNIAQVINCSAINCTLFDAKVKDNNAVYYPRYVDGANALLNCTKSEGNIGCELTETTTDNHQSSVYINSFYGDDNYDQQESLQLIMCDATALCKPTQIEVDDDSTKFYPNSDPVNTEPLKNDLIKCAVDGEGEAECTITSGKKNDVYLNSNFEVSEKQLLICLEEDGCTEVKVESTSPEYYVNAGNVSTDKLDDTLIKCTSATDACTIEEANDSEIYINTLDTSQTIQCYTDKGCIPVPSKATSTKNEIFLNSSDLNTENQTKLQNDLIKCVMDEDGNITCEAADGNADEVYINSHNTTEIIYCTSDGCINKASEAEPDKPEFYINADPTDEDPLSGDLIKCKNTGSKISCEVVTGKDGDVFLNANVENDSENNPLIICSADGCQTDASSASEESLPAYYVNSGSVLAAKLNDTLIQCTYEESAECAVVVAKANDVYVNYNNNTETYPLIKCTKNGCKISISSATENSNEYYINAGDTGEEALVYDIIECINEDDVVRCEELEDTNVGVYINSNYAESGDNNQLIQCLSDNGCEGIKTNEKSSEYYVNAEADGLTNAIIYCSNKKCEKQTPVGVPTYYVGISDTENINGLIECTEFEVSSTTEQVQKKKRTTEKKCKLKGAFTSSGYYLNGGYNKAINQTIVCDSSEGCITQNVDLGYYVNAGDSSHPIIKCEKEGAECVAEESVPCPKTEAAIAGNYCYEEDQLKFYPNSNSTAVTASKADDYYTFATIPSGGFPGIKSDTSTLFKISRYYINRFYQSGVVMIDKNGKLVDNLSSDQSEINLYDCSDSTKLCIQRPGCTSNTYMYDSENKKAVFCNNEKLEYADFTGYVIDGNRAVGSNHPYIIKCENKICKSIRPKSNSYYENNGYDSTTNALIQCSSNNCFTVTAEVGYYVGHDGDGIIQCTSTTSCTFTSSKNKVKYVNSGSDKTSNAIISCAKGGCSAVKANIGYYLTYSSSLLIQCTSPGNCVEFTPTVNYYDNADTSESSNSIINCVQSSQVINCALESTNNGFYMSSSPNVLIRCKSGSKCKTVIVKNGIFRGAIKGLLGGSKRSIEEATTNKAHNNEVEFDEDGSSVVMPRDSDDAYGIIRCVAGKCSFLTASEIASIPVCEFNNNKCYITLEYAMTKSATTSITAGNICTNADRSVFYFATDTIVVKLNVISGVTATYVYTTTNSNCLEVNDSYTDMYFTVGSNIYLLDQGSVLQFYETGYYFINTAKNSLVSGNDIDTYNDENVKLYKCNGSSCSITDKPDAMTYYADVNKRIVLYNINSDSYSFAYDKDITCIFANNKCTPNADLKNQEFCITYKGELALAKQDIKNRETGECYKASSITDGIYGYSQYLYNMNLFSAKMVDETGYYIVSLSTNTTVVSKNYKTKNNNLVIYGCQLSSCKEITPDENTYYYDARAKNILRYKDGIWSSPANSGYAYISIDPTNTYVYKFTKNLDEIKINAMANYGYYYTVDGEMYHCDRDEDGECSPIENTGYYFTNAGEVYYCVHDSEELEPTECTKQACVSGQYYYIDEAYYRCESSSTLVPVMSRYCSYNDNVIINFPLALTEEFPDKIKQAMEGIEKNNNSTAIVSRRGKNYLESVSGVFTNCTYNVEEIKSTFDLVCINNFVNIDENTDDVKICSIEQLGYVECIEDEENPEKCNISGSISRLSISVVTIIVVTLLSMLFNNHN